MRGFFPNGSKLAISSMLVCYSFPTVPKHWRDCEKNQEKQKEDIWGNKLKKRKRGKKNLECTLIHTLFTIYRPYRLPCAPFYWSKKKKWTPSPNCGSPWADWFILFTISITWFGLVNFGFYDNVNVFKVALTPTL